MRAAAGAPISSNGDVNLAAPVHVEFLDLPLLTDRDDPEAPRLAASADPWPGPTSLFTSASDEGYSFAHTWEGPSTVGVLLTDLAPHIPGTWGRGTLRVRVSGGELSSKSKLEVLNGANFAALRVGGEWEVVQFASAELIGAQTYLLGGLLRGQKGTDFLADQIVPAGAHFVLLDGTVPQIVGAFPLGLPRNILIGANGSPLNDDAVVQRTETSTGVGLRPYSVAHLQVRPVAGGLELRWLRQTRLAGDSWAGMEVPLGESRELYQVRVSRGSEIVREVFVDQPGWLYEAADQLADGGGNLTVEVAQASERFGAGPFKGININV